MPDRRRALMTEQESGPIVGYETVGSPTISGDTMTPSADSWVRTPVVFAPGNKSWEIIFRLKKKLSSGYQNLISGAGILIQNETGNYKCKLYLAHGSSFDIVNGGLLRQPTQNQWTYFRIKFDGSKYTYGISTDGVTYSDVTQSSASTIRGGGKISFGIKASNTSAVQADYDLSKMQIWIGGKLWWKAT